MNQEQLQRAKALLNPKELEALNRVIANPANRLSPATAARFFNLFLQGYSCEKIAEQNRGMGSLALGLVVRARIEFDWDLQRDEHSRELMAQVRLGAMQAVQESVRFSADGMAVFHRLVGDRFRQFLQSGDKEDLSELGNMPMSLYFRFADAIRKSIELKNAPPQLVEKEVRAIEEKRPAEITADSSEISDVEMLEYLDTLKGATKKEKK